MEFSEEVVIEGAAADVARTAFLNMDLIVEVTHELLHPFVLSFIRSLTNSSGAPIAQFVEADIVRTAR